MSTLRIRVYAQDAYKGLNRAFLVADKEVPKATFKSGAMAVTFVRSLASTGTHRPGLNHIEGTGPGPNVATGDYRRSITSTNAVLPGVAISDVDTNAVQAARLEYGFIGRDSLGRYFRQRPYPHWAPAEALVLPAADGFFEIAAQLIESAF